jgi:hypothetical protein
MATAQHLPPRNYTHVVLFNKSHPFLVDEGTFFVESIRNLSQELPDGFNTKNKLDINYRRLELKKKWPPGDVVTTFCIFAKVEKGNFTLYHTFILPVRHCRPEFVYLLL